MGILAGSVERVAPENETVDDGERQARRGRRPGGRATAGAMTSGRGMRGDWIDTETSGLLEGVGIRKHVQGFVKSPFLTRQPKPCERPPAESRWLRVTAEAGSVRHSADSGHVEIVVRLRRLLVLDVVHPDLVRHVSARRRPVSTRP